MRKHLITYLLFVGASAILYSFGCGGGAGSPQTHAQVPISIEDLGGEGGIETDSSFAYTFTKAVDTSTVTDSTFYIVEGTTCDPSNAIDATVECDSAGLICTLTLSDELDNGTVYTICLTASSDSGGIIYEDDTNFEGDEITFATKTETGIPVTPAGIVVTRGFSELTITWETMSDATSYDLYYDTSEGVTKDNGAKIDDVTSPYAHTDLTNGTTYYYILIANNDVGESEPSNETNGTPGFIGILDTSFGNSNGYVTKENDSDPDWNDIAIDGNGNIYFTEIADGAFVIWGVDEDGNNLSNFGTDGLVDGPDECVPEHGNIAIDTDADNNIFVAIKCGDAAVSTTLYKYDTNCDILDSVDFGIYVYDILIDEDDNIFISGMTSKPSRLVASIWKYKTDLTLDETFGTDGVAQYDPAEGDAVSIQKIALDEDGNIYGAGYSEEEGGEWEPYGAMIKFDADGRLDETFANEGVSNFDVICSINSLFYDSDGYLYITGGFGNGDDLTEGLLFISKQDTDGSTVTTFGTEGIYQYTEASAGNDIMLYDGDHLFVSGIAVSAIGNTELLLLALDKESGQIDTSFFTDGIYEMNGSFGFKMVLTSDDKIILNGYSDFYDFAGHMTIFRFE